MTLCGCVIEFIGHVVDLSTPLLLSSETFTPPHLLTGNSLKVHQYDCTLVHSYLCTFLVSSTNTTAVSHGWSSHDVFQQLVLVHPPVNTGIQSYLWFEVVASPALTEKRVL